MTVLTKKQREVLVARTLDQYAIVEGSVVGRSTLNHSTLFSRSARTSEKKKLNELFLKELKSVRRDWGYCLVCLHDKRGEVYYEFESGVMPNRTSGDINDEIAEMTRDFIKENSDDWECAFLWAVNPNDAYNWDVVIETIIDSAVEKGMLGDVYKGISQPSKLLPPREEREVDLYQLEELMVAIIDSDSVEYSDAQLDGAKLRLSQTLYFDLLASNTEPTIRRLVVKTLEGYRGMYGESCTKRFGIHDSELDTLLEEYME